MTGLSDPVTVSITVAGAVIVLALILLVRILLKREPSPPRWLRYRLGVFVERDPAPDQPDLDELNERLPR